MIKDVTHIELFETLLSGDIGDMYYDLHNDFECIRITYSLVEKKLELRFINDDYKLIVSFLGARLGHCNFNPTKPGKGNDMDLFYRGRFEMNNNLHEMTSKGEYYFYISFLEGDALEIFSRQALLELSRLNA
ncbi:hypothetical protein [Chitinophaga sp. HK235]|uniref:hypothetical protein n=1 Tax=Chitinophaga sp. HK235 TaxID=2952571 RepID=UPI001BA501C3|nr:hypothetical protein [Chitinophaga sp. HK235]